MEMLGIYALHNRGGRHWHSIASTTRTLVLGGGVLKYLHSLAL